jgi:hypothetical protein
MPGRSEGLVLLPRLDRGLQGSAYVVDSKVRMAGIDDFEDHVIAGLEGFDDGIELILGSGGVFVDAGNDQSGLQTLKICE